MAAARTAVVRCESYTEPEMTNALNEALSAIGGLDWVKPGMKIAIKANLAAASSPEHAVCTNPYLIASFAKLLIERGAEAVVGDSPGGLFNAAVMKHVYTSSGYNVIEETGARLNDNFDQCEALCPDGAAIKRYARTAWLDRADAEITFAKLKTHGMMGMTGAVKNFYGSVPGTVKLEYHYLHPNHEEFADMLVDLCEHNAPRLSIIDAVVAMDGNGPTAGRPRECGALIASLSPHEADVAGAKILGVDPNEVPTLERAAKRGLVDFASASEHTLGDPLDFKIPNCELIPRREITSVRNAKGVTLAFFRLITARRPMPDRSECVGCGLCAKLCPAKAITMKKKLPSIDRKKCIRCFCCQEFCPKGAMKVHRTWVAKLLNK